MSAVSTADMWSFVVGQRAAVEQLRSALVAPVHAYLLVGPSGCTKTEAARAFAAQRLTGSADANSRDAQLVLRAEHPDVQEVERSGQRISRDQAREIVRTSALAPTESAHKVMILHEFHLLEPEGAGILLKTIEEPPPSTTFIILADHVPHDLITISSRCARIDFGAINDTEVAEFLVAQGAEPSAAEAAALAAGGDLDRARVLVADPELAARRAAFAEVPYAVDGSGSTALRLVDGLLERIEAAAAPLEQVQADEATALDERIKQYGERGSGKKQLETRHKQQLRRHRTDELRSGLTVIAGEYRDAIVADAAADTDAATAAVRAIHQALTALNQNPNDTLLLQRLVWSLPPLSHQ